MILSAQTIRNLCLVGKSFHKAGDDRYLYYPSDPICRIWGWDTRDLQPIFLKGPLITPFFERTVHEGYTFGLSPAGYDIRIAQDVLVPAHGFKLASSMERFVLPTWLNMRIIDKSSWARRGICVQNTNGEPGWEGWLTLEITNHRGDCDMGIKAGTPIAQVQFELLDEPTVQPYEGKYQNQRDGIVEAILESVKSETDNLGHVYRNL